MSTTKSLGKLLARMILYGIGLGALAGFLVSLTISLTTSPYFTFGTIPSIILISIVFGGIFGMIFGGVGGVFSGLVMMLVTALFFREISYPRIYKYTMGIITFIMTGLVFMVGEFSAIDIADHQTWLMVTLLSILIAVAASQRAANQYLREIDIRKVKEK